MPPEPSYISSTIQRFQEQAGPQAKALSQSALAMYSASLTWLEVLSVLISGAFIAATIYLLIKTGWFRVRLERTQHILLKKDALRLHAKSSWSDIERHFFVGSDNDLKIALIKADTLLDEALIDAGVPGAQLGDRLKRVRPELLPNIEDIWQAHKIRNRIAHETDFVIKRDLAERALTVYEKALEYLGALDQEAIQGGPGAAAQ